MSELMGRAALQMRAGRASAAASSGSDVFWHNHGPRAGFRLFQGCVG